MRTFSLLAIVLLFPFATLAVPPMEKLDTALGRADLVVVGTLGKLTPIEGEKFGASGEISITEVLKGPADTKAVTLRTVDPEKARREGLVGAVIRNEGASGIWILRKQTDGQKFVAPNQTHLQPMEKLDECKRILKVGAKPAEQPKDGDWKNLFADEQWYKDHKQPEQVFTGTLQRHKEPEMSILMRPHRYKLGDHFLYPDKEHPDLEKLVGQKVEVRGKPYDVELEGQAVSEIWPAAIRAAGTTAAPKPVTLVKALEAWIVLLEANDVEAAQKQWAKDAAASEHMKQWWAKLRDCHKQYDYRKWLEKAKQIENATQFKVGGHDFGHMHVDWEKTDEGWRIAKVWICR